MYYDNVEIYLNEEVRRPIKHYLEGADEKTAKKVMNVVDYLCDKYREANGTAVFYGYGTVFKHSTYKEWQEFMLEKGYLNPIDYDELESPYTDEELKVLMQNLDEGADE